MRLLCLAATGLLTATPTAAQTQPQPQAETQAQLQASSPVIVVAPGRIYGTPTLPDAELAKVTGKFVLSNGVELALSIVSDTVVNGQLLLRTVFTVDRGPQLQVFGRNGSGTTLTYPTVTAASGETQMPAAIEVAIDRRAGLGTVTPTFTTTHSAPAVTVGAAPSQDPKDWGLSQLPLTLGGPGVATADGVVSLQALRSGTQVTLVGDQLSVANLVGQSVASAVVNSGDNRTIDTVTNVAIDLRNVAPYQIGAAQMRVDTLALDAARGMMR